MFVATLVTVAGVFLISSVPNCGQPYSGVSRSVFWFGGLTLYITLMNLCPGERGTARAIYHALIGYGLAASVLLDAAALIPGIRAIFVATQIGNRNGLVRINCVADICLLLCLTHFMGGLALRPAKSQSSTFAEAKQWLGFLLAATATLLVNMTRQYMFATVVLVVAIGALSLFFKHARLAPMLAAAMLGVAALLLASTGKGESFLGATIASLNPSGETADSGTVALRADGARFYLDQLALTHYVGIGWISTSKDAPRNAVTEAIERKHFLKADLGLIQGFTDFGFVAPGILIAFLWKAARHVRKLLESEPYEDRRIAFGIGGLFMMLLATANHFFFWPGLAINFTILAYILETLQPGPAARWQRMAVHLISSNGVTTGR